MERDAASDAAGARATDNAMSRAHVVLTSLNSNLSTARLSVAAAVPYPAIRVHREGVPDSVEAAISASFLRIPSRPGSARKAT